MLLNYKYFHVLEAARLEAEAARKAAEEERILSVSSAEKEAGNAFVQKKDMSSALLHYTSAIQIAIGEKYSRRDASEVPPKLLSLALSCFNNRSLAYLKLSKFRESATDASFVIDHYTEGGQTDAAEALVSKEMLVKALFRRAQALHGLSSSAATASTSEKERLLKEAAEDLSRALSVDPANAPAAKEQVVISQALANLTQQQQQQQQQKAPAQTVPQSAPAAAPVTAKVVPSNVDMVPRSSKRLQPAAAASSPPPAAPSEHKPSESDKQTAAPTKEAVAGIGGSNVKGSTPSKKSADGSVSSPSFVLSVPTEPPKTSYE